MELMVESHNTYIYTGTKALDSTRASVIFVHGAAMDHSVWILQSRYFAYHDYNVLAVDLPGHGRSQGDALSSIEEIADWLVQLMDAVGIDSATMIGHSMGSLSVLEAAARYPERINKIALLGTAVPMMVSEHLLNAAEANDQSAIDMITVWGHSGSSHFGGNTVPGLWMVGGGKRLLEQAATGVLYNDLKACNDYQNGLQVASAVQCPVLFILGQKDMMTPVRATKKMIDAMTTAGTKTQTVILPDCGHMMFYERPNETLDALIGFVG